MIPGHMQISPSVLSADFTKLAAELESLNSIGCKLLHLDIMDGLYVPNLTFGPLIVQAIRKLTDMELEAHLMITNPDQYIERFIQAGADLILVHPSTCPSLPKTLSQIRDLGAKSGLVINPDESLELALPYLEQIDQLLIMSVYPGFGGQKFIPEVLDDLPKHLEQIQQNGVTVELDGGVNLATLPGLLDTGIRRFVAGSAVFNRAGSPAHNYTQLTNLLG